ncbi:sensor histidine kinase [Streptomyces sp. NPDC059828]|uniref:sensor histidine kinase n=1 Tax=Streptomyces sp. NPDC059828 TaxID=3346965 RepID=UPI00364F7D6B
MRRRFAALFGARARRRWVHLILGGALLMPYWLLGMVAMGPLLGAEGIFGGSYAAQFGAYAVALPLAAATAVFPLTRLMSVAAAKALCGVAPELFADAPAVSRGARLRTAGWFTLHVGVGGLISGASLALPPFAVTTALLPLSAGVREWVRLPAALDRPWVLALAPFAGAAMLLALVGCAAAAGALLAWLAPALLGPTPADRVAAAERRAAELAARNRLARELHDSVGHALSAVTLQAGAALRVLDSDAPGHRAFVREALAAIEQTTRRTVGELDGVLGLLRQEDEPDEPHGLTGPTLESLELLIGNCGLTVAYRLGADLARVPERISRDAYRIVQEGLSNAQRYGGTDAAGSPHGVRRPVSLHIAREDDILLITVENPLPDRRAVVRPGGGRGLRGIAERAALLGGHAEAGPVDGGAWLLTARLPLAGARGAR